MSVSVTAIPRDFYIAAFSLFLCGTEIDWKRCADLWKEPSPILPSVFPFLAGTMQGESGSSSLQSAAGGAALLQYQSHTSIVIFPVLFVGAQLLVYFSCRKAGKPIWKNTAHMSSVITWPLCQALACWQLQDGEWVRPSCSQQEERGKKILICHGLLLPSLVFPSIFCSP